MCFRICCILYFFFFFFKQKTAYEMRISDWSSDVCSSDLVAGGGAALLPRSDGTEACRHVGLRQWQQIPVKDVQRHLAVRTGAEIGRASCRERVCQYV